MAVGEEVIVIGNPCTLTDNELSVFADANACAVGGAEVTFMLSLTITLPKIPLVA